MVSHSLQAAKETADEASNPLPGRLPLGQAINAATRTTHSQLNQSILARLPLVIPPQTETPSVYVSGLLCIAPIYIVFEAQWKRLLLLPRDNDDAPLRRIHAIVHSLWIPGLERTARLKSDIRAMTGWSAQTLEEQLRSVSETGHLSVFLAHAERVIEKRPAVLIAYAWVFYLALFSGGRVMRAALESAGEAFWRVIPDRIRPNLVACQPQPEEDESEDDVGAGAEVITNQCHHGRAARAATVPQTRQGRCFPLTFFHFATARDGEDLKADFKKRLAAADADGSALSTGNEGVATLSEEERDHVVHEACCIFDNLLLIVRYLDAVCGTKLGDASSSEGLAFLLGRGRGDRFRDSIAISKERTSRMAMKREMDDEGENDDGAYTATTADRGQEGQTTDRTVSSSESSSTSSGSSTSGGFVGQVQEVVAEMAAQVEDAVARRRAIPGGDVLTGSGVRWAAAPEKPRGGDEVRGGGTGRAESEQLDGQAEGAPGDEVVEKGRWLGRLSLSDVLFGLAVIGLAAFLRLLRL